MSLKSIGWLTMSMCLAVACTHRMPQIDLSKIDAAFLQRCAKEVGVVILSDERYEDYWGGGYDKTKWELLGDEQDRNITQAPASRMVVRRQLLRILSEDGANKAQSFSVIHYRERVPPVEVHVWTEDRAERPVRVDHVGVEPLVGWPCDLGFPRRSTFHIVSLNAGDTVEIISPISGPEQEFWHFGDSRFCLLRSKTTFGHADDEYRLDMAATVVDASGGVQAASAAGEYPQIFELQKPLMPISMQRLPYVMRSPRCPDWEHLRGRIFHTPLWLARSGSVGGKGGVHPFLLTPIKTGERLRRIQAVADWISKKIEIVQGAPTSAWLRWIPLEPVEKIASNHRASPGGTAALAFRILEEAGLAPRFALVQTQPQIPFRPEQPTAIQFDTLAVVAQDDNGRSLWFIPGQPFDPEQQPPQVLVGKSALVMERWFADRDLGGGSCVPQKELTFSCNSSTPEPVEVRLVSIVSSAAPNVLPTSQ